MDPRSEDPKPNYSRNYFRTNPTHAHGTSTSDGPTDGRTNYCSNNKPILHEWPLVGEASSCAASCFDLEILESSALVSYLVSLEM